MPLLKLDLLRIYFLDKWPCTKSIYIRPCQLILLWMTINVILPSLSISFSLYTKLQIDTKIQMIFITYDNKTNIFQFEIVFFYNRHSHILIFVLFKSIYEKGLSILWIINTYVVYYLCICDIWFCLYFLCLHNL